MDDICNDILKQNGRTDVVETVQGPLGCVAIRMMNYISSSRDIVGKGYSTADRVHDFHPIEH